MAEETRNAKLLLGVETKGSDKASKALEGIGKTAATLDKELASIGRGRQLDSLVGDFKAITKEGKAADEAIEKLNRELTKLGASENEIRGVARALSETGSAGGSAGGGNVPAAAKFRGVASMVGGGELVGVVDDIQDAVEGIGQLGGTLSGVLAPALSSGAVGMAAFLLPLAALSAVVVAVGFAVKGAVDEIQKQNKRLEQELTAERSALEAAFSGATVSEATAQIDQYNNMISAQTEFLSRNEGKAAARFDELVKAEEKATGFLADLTTRIRTLFGLNDVNTVTGAIEKSKEARDTAIAGEKEWREEVEAGSFKADEAAQKETVLADARADTGKATSVAADAEKEQAKAVEKAQQEQDKAQQDAEQRAEKATAAQTKYNEAIASAGETLKQATADINTKLKQGEDDIRISQGRDLDDIQLKNNKDVTKLISDDWRSARDDAFKNADEIDDIRREGLKSQKEAIREGDFKELFLSREATKERLDEEKRTDDREEQMRKIHLSDAKDDLKTALRDETSIRRNASLRQMEDLKLGAQRELQQATTAKMRALEANNAYYAAELRQLGSFNTQRLQMNAQANQQLLQQGGGSRARAGNTQSSTGISGQSTIDMSGVAGFVGRMIR